MSTPVSAEQPEQIPDGRPPGAQDGDRPPGTRNGHRPVRTAYLASHYPALSQSFILREVQAVRVEGVDVTTFTVRRSPRQDMRTAAMRAEDDATASIIGAGLD